MTRRCPMRNFKFYRGSLYREELQPLLQFCNALIADGERDTEALLAKSHDTAKQHPLALDCWNEIDGGLREILTGKLKDIEEKARQAEQEKAQRAEREAQRTKLIAALRIETVAEELDDETERPTKSARPARKSKLKTARRVAKSAESWRILRNYPEYEISSHGRVRSMNRARPSDFLKPRFVWHHGKVAEAFTLCSGGKEHTRFKGPLMVSAGLLKSPSWMNQGKE